MEVGRYQFTLSPGEDAPPVESPEFQSYVQMARDGFSGGGLTVVGGPSTPETTGFVGEVLIPMTQAVGPIIGAVVGAFVTLKVSRKVKIKIGDIEIEAFTADQAKDLIDYAAGKIVPQKGGSHT